MNLLKFLKCNLFHRHIWLGVRDCEKRGLKPRKALHCLLCDGPLDGGKND